MQSVTYLRAEDLRPFIGKNVRIERHTSPTHPVRSVVDGTLTDVQVHEGAEVSIVGTLLTKRGSTAVDLSCVLSLWENRKEVRAEEWFGRYDSRREVQAREIGLSAGMDLEEVAEIVCTEEERAADNLEALVGADAYVLGLLLTLEA